MIKNKIVKYYARKDSNIALKVIPGHFVTNHSHLNYYLDMTTMKTRQNEAERIAIAMKDYYNVMDKPIDTIVCLDGCEVIGAFLASELSRAGVLSTNAHKTIYVVTPEFNSNGQMIFRAIFSAVDSINGHRIDALFRADDIPNYEAFTHSDCPMCKEGKPVEALVNGYGYSEI